MRRHLEDVGIQRRPRDVTIPNSHQLRRSRIEKAVDGEESIVHPRLRRCASARANWGPPLQRRSVPRAKATGGATLTMGPIAG